MKLFLMRMRNTGAADHDFAAIAGNVDGVAEIGIRLTERGVDLQLFGEGGGCGGFRRF